MPTGQEKRSAEGLYNTSVALYQCLKEGTILVSDDGSVLLGGSGVIGRFASRSEAEKTLRAAHWEPGVADNYWRRVTDTSTSAERESFAIQMNAARWLQQLDAGTADLRVLQDWTQLSPAHLKAFLEQLAVLTAARAVRRA